MKVQHSHQAILPQPNQPSWIAIGTNDVELMGRLFKWLEKQTPAPHTTTTIKLLSKEPSL